MFMDSVCPITYVPERAHGKCVSFKYDMNAATMIRNDVDGHYCVVTKLHAFPDVRPDTDPRSPRHGSDMTR